MEFTPAPPDRLFEELRREKSRELERVEEVEEEVAPTLEELHAGATGGDDGEPSWRMLKGRETIVGRAVEVLEVAEEELRYLSTDPTRPSGRDDVEVDWQSALRERADELDVRVLLNPEPMDEDILKVFAETEGVELRITREGAQAQSILIDGEVFVWVVVGEDPQDDVALWSDAQDLYTSQRLLFDALWEGAKAI